MHVLAGKMFFVLHFLGMQEYTIESRLLKQKYQIPVRVRMYCISVEKRTHAKVDVLQVPRGEGKAKFRIKGEQAAVTHAIEYIQGEFIIRQVSCHALSLYVLT